MAAARVLHKLMCVCQQCLYSGSKLLPEYKHVHSPHTDMTVTQIKLNVSKTTGTAATECTAQAQQPQGPRGVGVEADLGMFSMFGRTGAPTKRGSTQKHKKFFSFFCNMVTSQKYCNQGIKETILCGVLASQTVIASNVPWWPVREVSWVHFQCKASSSVHCITCPQQHVNDDYCVCRVKAVGGRGY